MRVKCRYCDRYFNSEEETCPYCGTFQNLPVPVTDSVPRTVEELKDFARTHDLPLDRMRFFLGENYTGPRAFGIYRDERTGNFVVYKNKSDGSRAVRYRGTDEAYAVRELYEKMKDEAANQRAHQASGEPQYSYFTEEERQRDMNRRFGAGRNTMPLFRGILAVIVISVVLVFLAGIMTAFRSGRMTIEPMQGYYRYEDTTYYPWHGGWYYWDDVYDDWYETEPPLDFAEDYDAYYLTDSYYEIDDGRIDSFYNGSVYEDYYSANDTYSAYDSDDSYSSWNDDDWGDDDWDWGGDWDSDWTDWDSDW